MSDRQPTTLRFAVRAARGVPRPAIADALRRLMATPESPIAVFGVMDLALDHDLDDLDLWFRELGLTREQYEVIYDITRCGQPPTSWNGCRP